MTREEAIKNIKEHCYFASLLPQAKEALDVAIKALEQKPKTGHWIVLNDRYNNCSECGFHYDTWNNRTEGLPRIFDYCPICGAKMDESQESEGENGRYRISN